jgi:hypothetical protein
MSALGALPGFAFPALSYPESEYFEARGADLVSPSPGQVDLLVVTAKDGFAIYVREVVVNMGTVATVATRFGRYQIFNPDGRSLCVFDNPKSIPESSGGNWNWSDKIASTSVVGNVGYCPLPGLIVLPGYSIHVQCANCQIGDIFNGINLVGLSIPTAPNPQGQLRAMPTPIIL